MASLSTFLAAARIKDPQYRQYKIFFIKSSNLLDKHPHLHPRSFQITLFHLPNATKDERFVCFTNRANLEFPVGSTVDDKIGETHKCLLSDLRRRLMDAVHSYGGILEIKTATTSTMVTGIAIFVLGLAVTLVLTSGSFAVEEPDFSYSGHKGPDKWATLDPSFAMCENGEAQSPVNIVKKTAVYNPKLEPLTRDYKDVNATLIDNIVNIQLLFGNGAGAINIGGKQYKLIQTHWHSPSEHTIDGIRYDVEQHMVHQSADGCFSVIAILYRFGIPDPLLNQLEGHLKKLRSEAEIGHPGSRFPVELIRAADLESTNTYFRYIGSLTTPPCTEKVTWTILEKVREMSKQQVASLRAVMSKENKQNARPTQPLNGRTVELYVQT
ncbi:alpha carbonic anhydrase 1, chloroplastic-like isoform X1 [Papaver somniferum]|uniref:alpha carbonic anhydrase 1, chloroplastic-like isoform X1 n=1 Tax=Papaver somniferum TaxID=3469 RepID=UPI000E6FA54A|nr:alpha carbonic anhydrase 1, chloroplastic-like isoform X1 [Papaver somniferum]